MRVTRSAGTKCPLKWTRTVELAMTATICSGSAESVTP
jgi:hypothetical protein